MAWTMAGALTWVTIMPWTLTLGLGHPISLCVAGSALHTIFRERPATDHSDAASKVTRVRELAELRYNCTAPHRTTVSSHRSYKRQAETQTKKYDIFLCPNSELNFSCRCFRSSFRILICFFWPFLVVVALLSAFSLELSSRSRNV